MIIIPTINIKWLHENGIKWPIEHTLVRRVIYEQCITNINVRVLNKEKVMVLKENMFVWIKRQEMHIFGAGLLA
jgi:hypothetical protein